MIRSSSLPRWTTPLLLVAFGSDLFAQRPPYDVFPPADPPYYRVRCSCKSGLTGPCDLHWQALARKDACATLAPAYEQPDKADCQSTPSAAAVTGSAHPEPKVYRGLAYGEPENKFQMLDIFAPAEGKNHPVVIYVHGGGWHSGDKAEVHNKPKAHTDQGFVLASINYRLWTPPWSKDFPGTVTLKHEAQDVAKAIRWVHDHARDYGGDPAALIVIGHSAGAHLSALVCTDERYLKAEGLSLANIKGCVPIDGDSFDLPMHMKANAGKKVEATDRERFGAEHLQKDLSPVMHVAKGKNIPPFLILHIVDPDHPETQAQAERFAQVLRTAGVRAKTYGAAGKDHSTLNNDLGLPDDKPTQEMFEFLSRVSRRQ